MGIFVSIVSTQFPFEGTGKEYIGDDISEIATAVKVDYEMALEYATQSGVSEEPRENIFLQNLNPNKFNIIDLHSPTLVFRLSL